MRSDVRRVGVVGGGLMGSGIAEVCARAGMDVIVLEVDPESAQRSSDRIDQSLRRAVAAGKAKASEAKKAAEAKLSNAKTDFDVAKAQSELAVLAAQLSAIRRFRGQVGH